MKMADVNEEKNALLAQLSEEVVNCHSCPLSLTRNKVVFGEGNPYAPLVFVGEGPGQNEDATGRPFVGRAGALLDECMREHGITRNHVYICNVLKCRACIVENTRIRNRPPQSDELEACRDWLHRQLTIIKPLVIVCLGGPAANSLIHKDFKMLMERGKWFDSSPYCRYIVAALHPAYILRQHGEAFDKLRQSLIDDIGAARLKVIQAKREAPMELF
jgi:DNA polymerase